MLRKIELFFVFILVLFPLASRANFDYNNIITDEEAQDYNSMTKVEIQSFLETHNSTLANFFYEGNNPSPSEVATSGNNSEEKFFAVRSAAEIIWNAAQEARINPRFILATLQKEMGLIEDPNPEENQFGYAMGYGCPDSGGCNFRFKGFGKQVRSAALQFRYYIDNIHQYNYQPGKRSCIDDHTPFLPCTAKATEIEPQNRITAAMYVYTPHVSGNKLFRAIWERYGFDQAVTSENQPGILPEGALVKAKDNPEDVSVYLIHNNKKWPFASMNALVSRFDPQRILSISQDEIAKFETGPTIKFTNYAILISEDKNKYLVDGISKRLITSDAVFKKLGFSASELEPATVDELNALENGTDIVSADQSPFGKLYKDSKTKENFYVKDGKKYLILDPIISKVNYPTLKVTSATTATLNKIESVGPAKLIDGTLIKKDKDSIVYVISGGQRRAIKDGATFEALGYKWNSIVTVPNKVLNMHTVGPLIEK